MLPGPTNVPNRVMRAMLAPIINHRSDDFVELYSDVVGKTQQVFETQKMMLLPCLHLEQVQLKQVL